jgi:thiol-disulfide isomerase/thioredoxin
LVGWKTIISLTVSICAVSVLSLWGPLLVLGAGGPPTSDFQVFKNPPAANNLQFGTVDGKTVNLSDFKGKVVLLNFWRSNCPYCDMEKNQLSAMLKSLDKADIKVLCANLWDDPSWVKSQGTRMGAPYTVVTRSGNQKSVVENVVNGRLMGYYVLNESNEAIYEVKGFPSTYVIDKKGRVVATHMGLAKWSGSPVMRWLADLISEPGGTASEPNSDLPDWLDRLLGGSDGVKISDRIAHMSPGH